MKLIGFTRKMASKSTDLKEALSEKIPLYHDLVRNFRQVHGSNIINCVTVDSIYEGLHDICTVVRDTSEVDPKVGIRYRGLSIPEVLKLLPHHVGFFPSPEAVFWLLLTGDIPSQEQTASLITDWASRRQKRIDRWWSKDEANGTAVDTILRALPKDLTPLQKFSIALTALTKVDSNIRQLISTDVYNYENWEHTFEDSMELLAMLPAIVGLIATNHKAKCIIEDGGDWVHLLLEYLGNVSMQLKSKKLPLGNFLRLYIVLNADEDGGTPVTHISHILGSSELDVNKILAASALAFTNEPKTGTMPQYMEFLKNLQSKLGTEPKDDNLKEYAITVINKSERFIGFKKSDIPDPRYTALLNYAREYLAQSAEIKLSQNIARVFLSVLRNKEKNIIPEQSTIAGPIFQFYGMTDMSFNQVLLYMSRALGVVASIIWAKAMNLPVEYPKSKTTRSYIALIESSSKSKHSSKF